MGLSDKVAGKLKEITGKVTHDAGKELGGKGQQARGLVKDSADDIVNAAKKLTGTLPKAMPETAASRAGLLGFVAMAAILVVVFARYRSWRGPVGRSRLTT